LLGEASRFLGVLGGSLFALRVGNFFRFCPLYNYETRVFLHKTLVFLNETRVFFDETLGSKPGWSQDFLAFLVKFSLTFCGVFCQVGLHLLKACRGFGDGVICGAEMAVGGRLLFVGAGFKVSFSLEASGVYLSGGPKSQNPRGASGVLT